MSSHVYRHSVIELIKIPEFSPKYVLYAHGTNMVLVIPVASTHAVIIGLQGSCRGSIVQAIKDVLSVAQRVKVTVNVDSYSASS